MKSCDSASAYTAAIII